MRSWTHAEEEALRYLASRLSGPELAVAFDRTHDAIKHKASQLGISICRRSSGTELVPSHSSAVLRRVVEIINAELCPCCGKRTIGVRSTGLCGPCHYERLREVHEEEIARIDAQRSLWASRSKLRRRRKKFAPPDEAPA